MLPGVVAASVAASDPAGGLRLCRWAWRGLQLWRLQLRHRCLFCRPRRLALAAGDGSVSLGESINASYLSPYLESLGSDFRGGANFAFSGASTLPPNVPFSSAIQVQQFLRFKSRSMELVGQAQDGRANKELFRQALNIYEIGGRNFRIHNTGPLGCLPQKLAQPRKDDSSLDENGCLIPYNNASKEFNAQLVKYDFIANYREYGELLIFMF
ncbi:hypothetical protein ZIOFF_013563 [Zingiber officinale]|uniref:Uncharacterized protein n=1 Tax=Zingiber officinale TaxID=94328 RepID=A0A8J5HZP5_ZINOF|nr:hypothetical protein ZIOFF_013563 [Zingiber officinale]